MQQEQDIKIYIPQTRGSITPPAEPVRETDEHVAIWQPSARSETHRRDAPR